MRGASQRTSASRSRILQVDPLEGRFERRAIRVHLPDAEEEPCVGEDSAPSPDRLHAALDVVQHSLADLERRRRCIERRVEELLEPRLQVLADLREACGHIHLQSYFKSPRSRAALTISPAIGAAARAP